MPSIKLAVREEASPTSRLARADKMSSDKVDFLEDMVRPALDSLEALALADRLWGVRGGVAKQLDGYDDQNFRLQPTEVLNNPHLPYPCVDGYVLKVMNSKDSKNTNLVDEQNKVLINLADHGVKCPRPVKTKDGRTLSVETLTPGGPGHTVRLLEFVPGETLTRVPWHRDLGVQAGQEVARLDNIMEDISLPGLESRDFEWTLWQAPRVLKYLDVVADPQRRELVKEVLHAFTNAMDQRASDLQSDTGLIHGDYNEHNVVVQERDGRWTITGVLDLGDCHRAPRLFEVALAAVYMALQTGDPDTVGDVLAGYSQVRQKPVAGIDLLRICICARLVQSLVMGLRAHQKDPRNDYVLSSQMRGWTLLEELWTAQEGELEARWKSRTLAQPDS